MPTHKDLSHSWIAWFSGPECSYKAYVDVFSLCLAPARIQTCHVCLSPMRLSPMCRLCVCRLCAASVAYVSVAYVLRLSPMCLSPMRLLPMCLSPMRLSPMCLSPMLLHKQWYPKRPRFNCESELFTERSFGKACVVNHASSCVRLPIIAKCPKASARCNAYLGGR
jgi:hypothetical protein